MIRCRGIVLHDTDCGTYWAERLEKSGLNVVGVHPAGGVDAHLTLAACMELVKTDRFREFRQRMNRVGIAVEFEMHALTWILPRDLFDAHSDWFRMDENGERTPRFNCCASSDAAHRRRRPSPSSGTGPPFSPPPFPPTRASITSGSTMWRKRNAIVPGAGIFPHRTRPCSSPAPWRRECAGWTGRAGRLIWPTARR